VRYTGISNHGGTEHTANGTLKQRSELMKIRPIFHRQIAWPPSPSHSNSILPTLHCHSNNWLKRWSLKEIDVRHSINEVPCPAGTNRAHRTSTLPTAPCRWNGGSLVVENASRKGSKSNAWSTTPTKQAETTLHVLLARRWKCILAFLPLYDANPKIILEPQHYALRCDI
jgi:hypothetical protein